MHKFVFITGPTASGKTSLALQIAKQFGCEIINCDSVQVYKHIHIGAAKPTADELSQCPHHLFDYVDFPDEKTAGGYQRDFYSLIQSTQAPKRFLVVGGTGFYFQAIEKGMFESVEVPVQIHQQVELELTKPQGREQLFAELTRLDPASAAKIHPSDSYRLCRAIEVMRASGKIWSEIQKEFSAKEFPWPLLKLNVVWPREDLRKRIAIRADQMLRAGLLDESRQLKAKGFAEVGQEWAPMLSVGYKECLAFLDSASNGQTSKETQKTEAWLRDEIILRTSQLAKRQETWFKRDASAVQVSRAELQVTQLQELETFFNKKD